MNYTHKTKTRGSKREIKITVTKARRRETKCDVNKCKTTQAPDTVGNSPQVGNMEKKT